MTSTSEEEEETYNNSKNEWQVIRRTERKKLHRTQHNTTQHNTTQHNTTQHNTPETKIEIHNGYGLLTNETNADSINEIQVQRKSINLLQYS